MNLQALSAFLALLALAGALLWYALSGVEPHPFGEPRYKGDPVVVITADTPPIGDFIGDFYVNEQNPFVPYNLRVDEMGHGKGPKGPWKPTTPVQITPPKPMVWPKAVAGGPDVPTVHGLVIGTGADTQQPMVMASTPGSSDEPSRLSPGDRIGRWTLKSIDAGNIARFADDAGHEFPVVISPGKQEAPASKAPAAPGAKPAGATPTNTTPTNAAPAGDGSAPVKPPGDSPRPRSQRKKDKSGQNQ